MRFRKYHGAGNDFVMLTDLGARLGDAGTLAHDLVIALCDRHTGVGADGVIRIIGADGDGETAHAGAMYRMDYYNADGSVAEMCGNGIRCLIRHEQREGRIGDGEHRVLTPAGVVTVRTVDHGRLTVDMGTPRIAGRTDVNLDGSPVPGWKVSMGNPHFVVFVSEIGRGLDDATVLGLGSQLETHPEFPDKTNVEFVEVVDATRLRMRVWERGIGETLACGSGTCAAAVASAAQERSGPHVRVEVPGGELEVEWEPGGRVWLTGPAEEAFAGEIDAEWLERRGLASYSGLIGGRT